MKLYIWVIVAVVILAAVSVAGYLFVDKNRKDRKNELQEAYSYLRQAKDIKILKTDFDKSSYKLKTEELFFSEEAEDVESFIAVLAEIIEKSTVRVSGIKDIFTPDYRVELTCRRPAAIDFIFYEDTYAACLRNEDCFFFAEFSAENADILKKYFENQY